MTVLGLCCFTGGTCPELLLLLRIPGCEAGGGPLGAGAFLVLGSAWARLLVLVLEEGATFGGAESKETLRTAGREVDGGCGAGDLVEWGNVLLLTLLSAAAVVT